MLTISILGLASMFASPHKNGNRRQSGDDDSNYNVFYHIKYFMVLQTILCELVTIQLQMMHNLLCFVQVSQVRRLRAD